MRDVRVRPTFAVEVAGLTTAWFLYRWGRFAVRDQVPEAFDNAREVLDAEAAVGLAVEDEIQDVVLSNQPLVEFLNHYYVYAHFSVALVALVALWATAPAAYRRMRRILVAATMFGLVIHAAYPLAPPRLVPEMAMVDTLATFGPQVYSRNHFESVANQFAAMPSFHVGWAALAAGAVIAAWRSPWRWLALIHPALMTVAVVATANHYIVDAVAGVTVIAVVALADASFAGRFGRRRGDDVPAATLTAAAPSPPPALGTTPTRPRPV